MTGNLFIFWQQLQTHNVPNQRTSPLSVRARCNARHGLFHSNHRLSHLQDIQDASDRKRACLLPARLAGHSRSRETLRPEPSRSAECASLRCHWSRVRADVRAERTSDSIESKTLATSDQIHRGSRESHSRRDPVY